MLNRLAAYQRACLARRYTRATPNTTSGGRRQLRSALPTRLCVEAASSAAPLLLVQSKLNQAVTSYYFFLGASRTYPTFLPTVRGVLANTRPLFSL